MVRISSFAVFHVMLLKPLRKQYLRSCKDNPVCITLTNVFFYKIQRACQKPLLSSNVSIKSSISQMIFQSSSDGGDEKKTLTLIKRCSDGGVPKSTNMLLHSMG